MTNIRLRLRNNHGGDFIAELVSPSPVFGDRISLLLAGDVVREYWVEGLGDSVFAQDGPGGEISLVSADVFVRETSDSRVRNSGRTGL